MTEKYEDAQIRAHYRHLTEYLILNQLQITTMESATAGQIASLITDTEGSSAVLKEAFVTYCNEAKIRSGVPEEVIRTYTVYSAETARAMAEACRKATSADIGIGITGTMGNTDPVNPENSLPGVLYFAIAVKEKTEDFRIELPPMPDRHAYKMAAAEEVYEKLIRLLTE